MWRQGNPRVSQLDEVVRYLCPALVEELSIATSADDVLGGHVLGAMARAPVLGILRAGPELHGADYSGHAPYALVLRGLAPGDNVAPAKSRVVQTGVTEDGGELRALPGDCTVKAVDDQRSTVIELASHDRGHALHNAGVGLCAW